MIKKVKTTDLRLGMYIHDLNVPWLEHNFVLNHFMLQYDKQIEKILKANIIEVLVDTEKGLDPAHSPTFEEAETALLDKMVDVISTLKAVPTSQELEMRWEESKQVQSEAITTVNKILHDVRIGKQVSIAQATPLVANIADSILSSDGTLISLCRIKQSDSYTFQHSVSVSALLISLCNAIGGFSSNELMEIGLGGMFHDIGKMKVAEKILNKPGPLTDDEFLVMKTHVSEGIQHLHTEPGLSKTTLKAAAEHHERYDGSGYPAGLSGSDISKVGQMTAIVDVYDAITSIRIYHTALEPPDALRRIFEWSGRHFDETLVQTFIKSIGIYPVGSLVKLNSGKLGLVLHQDRDNMLQPLVRVMYNADRGHRVPVQDINLAAPGCQDYIVGYESPMGWGIDPLKYMLAKKS
jgi:putative nucleotidyltransferase with HDIG domain